MGTTALRYHHADLRTSTTEMTATANGVCKRKIDGLTDMQIRKHTDP